MASPEPLAPSRHFLFLVSAAFVLSAVLSGMHLGPNRVNAADIPAASPGATSSDAEKQHRKAELDEMRLRSEATKVYRADA